MSSLLAVRQHRSPRVDRAFLQPHRGGMGAGVEARRADGSGSQALGLGLERGDLLATGLAPGRPHVHDGTAARSVANKEEEILRRYGDQARLRPSPRDGRIGRIRGQDGTLCLFDVLAVRLVSSPASHAGEPEYHHQEVFTWQPTSPLREGVRIQTACSLALRWLGAPTVVVTQSRPDPMTRPGVRRTRWMDGWTRLLLTLEWATSQALGGGGMRRESLCARTVGSLPRTRSIDW